MARIDKPIVGGKYWTQYGNRVEVRAISDDETECNGLVWNDPKVAECGSWEYLKGWPLYDADPTAKPALPALDLSKPVKRRDGALVRNVREDCGIIRFQSLVGDGWINSERPLSGRAYGGSCESPTDLIQCVRRDWTQADVPRPWASLALRLIDDIDKDEYSIGSIRKHGLRICNFGIAEWKSLASDWEYTTDGKTWQPCCKWE